MIGSIYHKIVWAYCKEYGNREIPLVFLSNCKPGYVINQWIFYLVDEGITPSKLELYLRSMTGLYDLCVALYRGNPLSENDASILMALYIDARIYGTDKFCIKKTDNRLTNLGLFWKPTKKTNIMQNIIAMNKFDKFQQTYHGSTALNPSENIFMSTYEIYRDFVRRTKWDPKLHLFPSRQHTKEVFQANIGSEDHSRKKGKSKRQTPKAFPLNRFIELVESCPNSRDKMFILLMGGGSLRMSEPLHLLFTDIEGIDRYGQTSVRLEDPETGRMEWVEKDGERCYGLRTEYFEKCWKNEQLSSGHPLRGLMPRVMYGKRRHGLHSGWKGMTFHASQGTERFASGIDGRPYDVHYIFWLDPKIGAYFHSCYKDYMERYIYQNPFTGKLNPKGFPWHPWLFIDISKKNYGYPLSYSAAEKIWDRRLAKLRLRNMGLGEHSLRHFYGYYCANILRLELAQTQVLMHHSSIDSTQVYYNLDDSTTRQELTKASLVSRGINPDFLIMPGAPRIVLPQHWTNPTHDHTMNVLLRR